MPAMNMVQALNSAMDVMLSRDRDVVIFGEDVGYFGGVFRVTDGLQKKYGKERVFDTPIAEGGIVGVAVGMGAYGLRPVVEVQFADYIYPAMDVMLERDPRVVILGEDVGYFGGVFRVTEGLQRKYGEHRVLDTPIAEGGIVAAAIGMGVNGLKPVAEIQFADYIYPGFDQVVSELAT